MPELRVRSMSGGGFRTVASSAYKDEAELENFIRDQPDVILPWADFADDALPPIVIGKQTDLPSAGVADLIAVSEDGYLTVVECKLNRNPEVRRTVVGQVLSYAAYLRHLSLAEFEDVVSRPYFDKHSELRGHSLAEGVGILRAKRRQELGRESEDNWTAQRFIDEFEMQRTSGQMRLLVVVDHLNDDLRRIIEFLSEGTAGRLQVLACALNPFASEDLQVLVPEVVGYRSTTRPPQVDGGRRGALTEDSYAAQVKNRDGGVRVLAELKRIALDNADAGDYIKWNPASFVYRAQTPSGETTIIWCSLESIGVPIGHLRELGPQPFVALVDDFKQIPPIAAALQRGKREAWIVYSRVSFSNTDAEQMAEALGRYLDRVREKESVSS